jgi:hypothetical protein
MKKNFAACCAAVAFWSDSIMPAKVSGRASYGGIGS